MRKSVVLGLVAAVWLSPAQAQPGAEREAALAKVCAQVTCRQASRQLDMRGGDSRLFRIQTTRYPFLDPDGTVIIYPGETIVVTFEKTADGSLGRPVLLKTRETGDPPEITPNALSFNFFQMEGRPDMDLRIYNRTGLTLKYDALMFVPTERGVENAATSSCPLIVPPENSVAEFSTTEHWPHPIMMLVLAKIRILAQGASLACN